VVVFNCSDQMNKDSMAQIFMGLSQSGAWGCFDEFNRITVEVLSVVSTQVKCILDALKEKRPKFAFTELGEINLQDTVGFFITMNPGYAGRTELPENLKALFRSCAMVVPDLVLICENMLMSEGFTQAKELSRKFVSLYMLSRELLSKQRHYDWALRAVKSVLRQAGKLKRSDPEIPEDPLLMRALRDFNMPKIVTDDKPIFLRLIGDLFPRVECPSKTNPEFTKIAKDTTQRDMGLLPEDAFVIKIVQLAEILEVRHCCFVIGPPGCGKTAVWKSLIKTYCNNGEESEYDTLNPKAISSDELFGAYNRSKEWKNGVLSVIMKNQVKNEDKYKSSQAYKWSVLDGDIDPEWIESLNTVMDDNKVLTLVSNDRIPLSPQMRLIFEISNLKNATPATVSRAGVLFINDTDIGWTPYMNAWLDRSTINLLKGTKDGANLPDVFPVIDDVAKSTFLRCFQAYFEQNADIHDKAKVRHIAPMVDMGMVQAITTILDALLIEDGH
jgi:dynein heavy chain, axonemal